MSGTWKVVTGTICGVILAGSALWVPAEDRAPRNPVQFAQTLSDDPNNSPPPEVCLEQPMFDTIPGWILAVVTLANAGSEGRILIEVRNWAPEALEHVVADGFAGNGLLGFHVDEVVPVDSRRSVPMVVDYPSNDRDGVGPMVLSPQGMSGGTCTALVATMGCWCDHTRRPDVGKLNGLRFEVVFANGLRGQAEVQSCPDTGSIWVQAPDQVDRFACTPGTGLAVITLPKS
jgi:hypothetical protein